MEKSKALEFLRGVAEKTERRRIPWQPTATEDFVAAIGGEFSLRVFRYWQDGDQFYGLELRDAEGRELIRLAAEDEDDLGMKISQLYETARQQALQVDEKLDKLLGVLERL